MPSASAWRQIMRKSIEVEVRGLMTPRERIWAAVLSFGRVPATGKPFTQGQAQDRCNPMVPISAVDDYFEDLERGGYIARVSAGKPIKGMPAHVTSGIEYRLVKEQYEAPRLAAGRTVTMGIGVLAMWRAMKVLQKGFDHHEIARAASQEGLVVKTSAAKAYVNALARAGYFQVLRAGKPGTATRYRLAKNTGPHAPAITRRKCVFDRNIGSFVELETAQEVCDGLD
jgi:hypothetical protein